MPDTFLRTRFHWGRKKDRSAEALRQLCVEETVALEGRIPQRQHLSSHISWCHLCLCP